MKRSRALSEQIGNCAKLIELGEVFALVKFPSQREASHTLQSWRIFQSWQKFGRGTNFAWQNSEAVVPNRLILVKFLYPAKWGKVASDGMRILLLFSSFQKKASSCSVFELNRAQINKFGKREFASLFLNLIFNNPEVKQNVLCRI